jgi:hypothetical protein
VTQLLALHRDALRIQGLGDPHPVVMAATRLIEWSREAEAKAKD